MTTTNTRECRPDDTGSPVFTRDSLLGSLAGRDAIVTEAKRAQDDERYGHFTHPFILGLLTAVAILDGTYDKGRWV